MNKKIQYNMYFILTVLLATISAATIAEAGVNDKPFSIGPRMSYVDSDDADDEELYGGAQLRYKLSESLGFEGSIDYLKQDFGATEVKQYPVQASLLAYLTPAYDYSPFLLGGVGWYYTDIDGPGDNDKENRFGVHAGAGIEFKLNEGLSLDATYRYIWKEEIESEDANLLDKDYEDDGSMITVGLNFLF